jgi:hypothetical protein
MCISGYQEGFSYSPDYTHLAREDYNRRLRMASSSSSNELFNCWSIQGKNSQFNLSKLEKFLVADPIRSISMQQAKLTIVSGLQSFDLQTIHLY